METTKRACSSFIYGVTDCIRGMSPILKNIIGVQEHDSKRTNVQRSSTRHSNPQETIRDKLFQCVVFGVIFWLPNFLFNSFSEKYAFHAFAEWADEDPNSSEVIRSRRVFCTLFYIIWVLPGLVVSKILNYIWYEDIAKLILTQSGIKRNTIRNLPFSLADLGKTLGVQMLYCLQGYAVYFLPLPAYLQFIWYLFHLSLLTSLYSFEYKWWYVGLHLDRRILNIDRKWPYYLGFGFPLALITTMFESFVDGIIVFSILFPMYIISSSVTADIKSPIFSHPFNTFKLADWLVDFAIACFKKYFKC